MTNEIILFESSDESMHIAVECDGNTVWLSKEQMALLFGRDRTVISRHVSNVYKEGELKKDSTCAKFAQVQKEGSRNVTRYELFARRKIRRLDSPQKASKIGDI